MQYMRKPANYDRTANINLLCPADKLCLRQLEYLSPTSMGEFYKDPNKFFLERIAPFRAERYPQTPAMAVGSAFDAYIKAALACAFKGILVGADGQPYVGDMFDYDQSGVPLMLFKSVDEDNWNFAVTAGQKCLKAYLNSDAAYDLIARLKKAKSLHMESSCLKVVGEGTQGGGAPIMGKPDIAYVDEHGRQIILDWKVNGFCGTSTTRPTAGHLLHKKAVLMDSLGFKHNIEMPKGFYAYRDQVTTYGWLLGASPEDNIFIGIDQLTCNANQGISNIVTYQHRYIVSESTDLLTRYQKAWQILNDYDLACEYFGDIVNVPSEIAMER